MATENFIVEELGRTIGAQRKQSEATNEQLGALTRTVTGVASDSRELNQRFGAAFGQIERLLEKQSKSLAALHIGSRHAASPELSGRVRLIRHAVLHAVKGPGDDALRTWIKRYGSRSQREELEAGATPVLRGSREELQTRTATGPAMVSVPSYAGILTQVDLLDFLISTPRPSAFAQLVARGGVLLDANSRIAIPQPSGSGSWVGEGMPIAIAQGVISAPVLEPRKVGVAATFTSELVSLSLPSIENVIEHLLSEDLRRVLDTSLVDANPASAIRPAGLRNGVAGLPASALTDATQAMLADIRALIGAVVSAGGVEPVLLLNTSQTIALAALFGAGLPAVISSPSIPVGLVLAVDAASFAASLADPRMSIGSHAVVHEESTTPLPISTTGTPNVVAAPSRSLWQTSSQGLRLIFDASWTLAGSGKIAWAQSVLW